MSNIGLTSEQAAKLLQEWGPNRIEEKRKTPLIVHFLKQFKDLMVVILIVASVFAYFAGETVDAIIILGIVFLNATIGFAQEYKAEKAIEALKKLLAPKARVVRDGAQQLIEAEKLVPGDLIILNEGDKVSADSNLIEQNEIQVDESILTGESVPVSKDTDENKKIFMGTQITHGTGRCLVTHTGMHTEFGRIATLTSTTKKDKSPLQKELAHIGLFVGKVTFVISVVLFLIGIYVHKRSIIETLLFAVSVAVAAVPEGLPTTITVALALGVQRLAKKNAIVKQLSSVETLGSTTVICSDKTGTLTKNEMTVQEIVMDNYEMAVRGIGYEPVGEFSIHYHEAAENSFFEYSNADRADIAYKRTAFYEHFELLMRTALMANNARITVSEEQWRILGDPTEGALITAAEKAGFTMASIHKKHKRIFEIPFDSERKRMTVIAQEAETEKITAYVKGAPDSLLELCTHTIEQGKRVPFTEAKKSLVLKQTEHMAQKALRTIAVACRTIDKELQTTYKKESVEKDLIFLGVFGMIDPPRAEVKEAVKLTHKAGIRVFIITGDHGLTAHAIAKDLGITQSYGVSVVTGEMLNKMSDDKVLSLVQPGQETIFARVSPEHKLRIVDALKRSGEVVAVTGDGVNDAPALKRADIGVAMGITGTDVSKEAANMVLTDDSFSTIVTAVIEGRTIYENMKKFIFFIFSSNIGELLAVFLALMIGLPAPLTAVLILIINTLTDVFPSLALGVEPVERTILENPPRKADAKIMEWPFIRRYLISGLYIGLVTVGTFIGNLSAHGWSFGETIDTNSSLYRQSATMAFVVLTLLQMVHAFNSRSERGSVFKMNLLSNISLIGAVIFSVLGTIAIVEIPFFQEYLKTSDLNGNQWFMLSLLACSILFFEELRKFWARLKMPLLRT